MRNGFLERLEDRVTPVENSRSPPRASSVCAGQRPANVADNSAGGLPGR